MAASLGVPGAEDTAQPKGGGGVGGGRVTLLLDTSSEGQLWTHRDNRATEGLSCNQGPAPEANGTVAEGLEATMGLTWLKSTCARATVPAVTAAAGQKTVTPRGCGPRSEHPARSVPRSHGCAQSGRLQAGRVLGPARKPVWLEGEKPGGQMQGQSVQGPRDLGSRLGRGHWCALRRRASCRRLPPVPAAQQAAEDGQAGRLVRTERGRPGWRGGRGRCRQWPAREGDLLRGFQSRKQHSQLPLRISGSRMSEARAPEGASLRPEPRGSESTRPRNLHVSGPLGLSQESPDHT